AHEQHVIHRDIKPANVVLRPDGSVKVLDFGLAKAVAPSAPGGGDTTLSMSPTMTAASAAGVVLGTAPYMSPEQARGKPVDRRADIWALGCVLYEMLTGQRLFTGETVSDILAAVLREEIDLSVLPRSTPASVRALLARCLDRDPRTRLRDAGEARIALAAPGISAAEAGAEARPRPGAMWITVLAVVALLAGVAIGNLVLAPSPAEPQKFALEVSVPERRTVVGSFSLSPDGTKLVFLSKGEDRDAELWLRLLDSFDAVPLPGTSGAELPFWSPAGKEIAFFANDHLFRATLDGRAPRRIAAAHDAYGGTWSQDGVIVFGTADGPIFRVSAGGGEPVAITEMDEEMENAHTWPAFLPDGKRFVFLTDSATDEGHRVRLAGLDGGEPRTLLTVIRSNLAIDPTGSLLLVQQNQLVAYPMDMDTGAITDAPVFVMDEIYEVGPRHQMPFSISAGGALAYQHGSNEVDLVQLDLDGESQSLIGSGRFGNPKLSPDGQRLIFDEEPTPTEWLIWVHDLERGVRTLISDRGTRSTDGVWSPEGGTIYYTTQVDGSWTAQSEPASGGGVPQSLGAPTNNNFGILDCSRDGRWLLATVELEGDRDLFLYPLDSQDAKWTPWRVSSAAEGAGGFSPDSRWIVFASDVSGRDEVYVAPIEQDRGDSLRQISASGGFEPRFSHDGTRIYYHSHEGDLVSVAVDLSADEVIAGTPEALFDLMVPVELGFYRNTFDLAPDGQSLVVIRAPDTSDRAIRVRTGWRVSQE
ncbi:MAG: protein kinase, partial [Acidobacteria bacterium]|nr:protein kinase [Acidobacteriota bacterium]